jgi:hypothetical protein
MSAEAIPTVLDVVVFSASGWHIGFEAAAVRGARPVIAPPENAVAIETLLGLPAGSAPTGLAQWLDIKCPQPSQNREILVGGPVELLTLPVSAIHPLPPLLAARNRLHGLRALALAADIHAGRLMLLFAADQLQKP